jgi:hypothetical protein
MGAYLARTGSARPIGFALFSTYAKDEWLRHRNQYPRESGGFPRVLDGQQRTAFLHTVNSALARSMGRRRATWAGANPYPHPL